MTIITDGTAHTSPVGESLGECLVRGRRSTKVNSLSGLCCPPAPRGPRHSGLQPAPPTRALTKAPIHLPLQSDPFTRVPWAYRPQPPPAPRHWSNALPVRPRVPPTTAPPDSKLRRGSFPTAGTLRQLLIGLARQLLLLIGWRGAPMGGAVACRSGLRLAVSALVWAGLS